MLRIGLTGSIGAGKSTVARIFETLSIPVFYADQETKRLYESNADLRALLIKGFGEQVYSHGKLDRLYLSQKVFGDETLLRQLNSIVHPFAIIAAEKWMKEQQSPYIIKEAALIFESGSGASLDYVIGVTAPHHLRIHRAMQRDHLTREQVLSRESKQISDSIKMKLCDFVIVNNEQRFLTTQVLDLHHHLLALERK